MFSFTAVKANKFQKLRKRKCNYCIRHNNFREDLCEQLKQKHINDALYIPSECTLFIEANYKIILILG